MPRQTYDGIAVAVLLCTTAAWAQPAPAAAQLAPGQTCTLLTQANADASAGTPNVQHDGSPPGIPPPDISLGFKGIPRRLRQECPAARANRHQAADAIAFMRRSSCRPI